MRKIEIICSDSASKIIESLVATMQSYATEERSCAINLECGPISSKFTFDPFRYHKIKSMAVSEAFSSQEFETKEL